MVFEGYLNMIYYLDLIPLIDMHLKSTLVYND